jgi:hypothetical protein
LTDSQIGSIARHNPSRLDGSGVNGNRPKIVSRSIDSPSNESEWAALEKQP